MKVELRLILKGIRRVQDEIEALEALSSVAICHLVKQVRSIFNHNARILPNPGIPLVESSEFANSKNLSNLGLEHRKCCIFRLFIDEDDDTVGAVDVVAPGATPRSNKTRPSCDALLNHTYYHREKYYFGDNNNLAWTERSGISICRRAHVSLGVNSNVIRFRVKEVGTLLLIAMLQPPTRYLGLVPCSETIVAETILTLWRAGNHVMQQRLVSSLYFCLFPLLFKGERLQQRQIVTSDVLRLSHCSSCGWRQVFGLRQGEAVG